MAPSFHYLSEENGVEVPEHPRGSIDGSLALPWQALSTDNVGNGPCVDSISSDTYHAELTELEKAFTRQCTELIAWYSSKPASYGGLMELIDMLNSQAAALEAAREPFTVPDLSEEEEAPVVPTVGELIPKWVLPLAPPPIAPASVSELSTISSGDGTQKAVPVDPARQGSKSYRIPDHLPKRPFYLPVIGRPGERLYYSGTRDGHEGFARCEPLIAYALPSESNVAGSGRPLRFAELPAHFAENQRIFEFIWEEWSKGRRLEEWCSDVEGHRWGFADPNVATREEEEREPCLCSWWEGLDEAQMEELDEMWSQFGVATGPPVLLGEQSGFCDRPGLMGDKTSNGGIFVRPSELQAYLAGLEERWERRMELFVEEVRAVAAQEPRGGSQGPNPWVYTPAATEPGLVSIIDGYDDGHLGLDFPSLVPVVLQGNHPLAIPPRSTWPLREAAIHGDDLIAL
ncbi:hypothetical protein TWF730_011337 [Orbilia blumenaviensis]|uniref:Uncharacterized protein n=1 Tax=Orbilia blumenaviensis TaxID=1796055 RepID=A0AAV9UK53_9PEZI